MEKQIKNKNVEKVFTIIKIITLGLVLPIILLNRQLLGYLFDFDLFLVHVAMYVAEFIILMLITQNHKVSFITLNIIELIFAVISSLKIATRCEILEPWDLVLTGNVKDLTTFINVDFSWIMKLVTSIIFLVGITIIQIFVFGEYCEIPKSKLKNTGLVALSILSLTFFITSYKSVRAKYIMPYQGGYNNFQQVGDIGSLGALDNFLIDIGMMNFANSCDGYSEEKIDEIYKKYREYNIKLSDNAREYDNVIIILLESFIDVTKLDGLEFDNDPLENYHKYFDETNSGYLNVTTIGGGTSNSEYMGLTGYSVKQYPNGIYPYMHCIKREVEALPRVFKDNGYETTRNTFV